MCYFKPSLTNGTTEGFGQYTYVKLISRNTHFTTLSKNSMVKKWLQMFPSRNKSLSLASGSFIFECSSDISLYSTT